MHKDTASPSQKVATSTYSVQQQHRPSPQQLTVDASKATVRWWSSILDDEEFIRMSKNSQRFVTLETVERISELSTTAEED